MVKSVYRQYFSINVCNLFNMSRMSFPGPKIRIYAHVLDKKCINHKVFIFPGLFEANL